MRVRYFSWSRRVRERSAVKVRSGAWGLVTGTGWIKPLGVSHEFHRCGLALFRRAEAGGGPGLALEGVDALGLLAGLVHGENQTAVHELLVDVDCWWW